VTFITFYNPSFHHFNIGYYWNQVISPHSDTGYPGLQHFVSFIAVNIVQEEYPRLLVLLFLHSHHILPLCIAGSRSPQARLTDKLVTQTPRLQLPFAAVHVHIRTRTTSSFSLRRQILEHSALERSAASISCLKTH
jgi:hypothetical protein